MEFSIATTTDNSLEKVLLTDAATRAQVTILPQYGAMLHAFTVDTGKGMHNILNNYSGADEIQKELANSFKSSKLSPFACRIPDGKYLYDGNELELENKFSDGTAIHGLLYNKVFEKVNTFFDEHSALASFKYSYKKEDNGYPFYYTCEIEYTLLPQCRLQVQTTIVNLDDLPIPMMDGWHPYFTLGGKINDWLLYFGAEAMVEFDEKLVPTGRLLPYDAFNKARPINDTMLDNCFLLNGEKGQAACTLRNNSTGLQLNLFPDDAYPYLQIFTPPGRQSIAIENLSAAPNAFNNKMGLIMLQPGQAHTFTVHYQVDCG